MGFSLGSLLPLAGTIGGGALFGPQGAAIGGGLGGTLEGILSPGGPASTFSQAQIDEQLARERAAYAQQQHLAQVLFDIQSGRTPSVASRDLGAGLDQITRGANSMAAGARGEGGALARYAAMQAAANAAAQTNQAQAVAGARERAAAAAQLGTVLGGMSNTASTDLRAMGQERDAVAQANAANKQRMEMSGLNALGQGLAVAATARPPTSVSNPNAVSGAAAGRAGYDAASANNGTSIPTSTLASTLLLPKPDDELEDPDFGSAPSSSTTYRAPSNSVGMR